MKRSKLFSNCPCFRAYLKYPPNPEWRPPSPLCRNKVPAHITYHVLSSPPLGFLHSTHLLACSFQRDRDYNVHHLHRGPLEHEPAFQKKLDSENTSLLPRKKKKRRPKLIHQKILVAIHHVSVRMENLAQKPCLDPSQAPCRCLQVAK